MVLANSAQLEQSIIWESVKYPLNHAHQTVSILVVAVFVLLVFSRLDRSVDSVQRMQFWTEADVSVFKISLIYRVSANNALKTLLSMELFAEQIHQLTVDKMQPGMEKFVLALLASLTSQEYV